MSHYENVLQTFFPSDSPRKEVYFMAVIDILQHYDAKKKAAHAAKTVKHGVSALKQIQLFIYFCNILSGILLICRVISL